MKSFVSSLLLLLLLNSLLFSQVEYFVQVNPATCTYNIIDSLPGVKWISSAASYDKVNKKYIFHGKDVNLDGYLYSINSLNADILSSPQWTDYYGLMEFDNSNGNLYGIHWTSTLSSANFVSINASDLTNTIIKSINLTSMTGHVTFDDNNHKFIFIANDSIGSKRLFSINATTGNVTSKPAFNSDIISIQFDNSSGVLYGLKWDSSLQTVYLVSIDLINGTTTNISAIVGVNSNINYATFDEINHRYTFMWTDNNDSNKNYLYTINAITGIVVSNPIFPIFTIPYNLINFRYDNSTGNLYALHWGPIDEITDVENHYFRSIVLEQNVPNPFAEQTIINYTLPENTVKAQMLFYNSQGKLIQSTELTQKGNGQLNVFASDLSSGIYTYTLVVDGKIVETKRMVKQ